MKKKNGFFNKIKIRLKKINNLVLFVKRQNNLMYVYILFDIFWSYIRYGLSMDEYKLYEFYNVSSDKRKTYLSKSKYEFKRKFYLNKDILGIINDKEILYKRFNSLLNRKILNVNDLSYKEFEDLLLKNNKIIARSINKDFVSSHKIYNIKDYRGAGFILEDIKKNKLYLVEELYDQNNDLDKITNNLVIINITTIINKNRVNILSITFNFKNNKKIIKGVINSKTLKSVGYMRDEKYSIYNQNKDYSFPFLKDMIEYCKIFAHELEEIKEITWSFGITNKNKIYFMDAHLFDEIEFLQIPDYLNNKVGLLPKYKKYMKK